MKKIILSCAALVMAAFMFNSCSMEKRQYMKGYHVEWNHNKEITTTNNNNNDVAKQVGVLPSQTANTVAANENQSAVATVANAARVAPVVKKNAVANIIPAIASHKAVNAAPSAVVKKAPTKSKSAGHGGPSKGLLIVLAIFIPWLAVGLATDWDVKKVIICVLLGFLFCLPGIIYAIVVVNKNS
ncbi:MAG: YqaE/Pmp3 family membrane protein [Bacteroidetes bacterium]|nr:YqaE/Pmp3 family membrane protein [Bacteroidota bacterium]